MGNPTIGDWYTFMHFTNLSDAALPIYCVDFCGCGLLCIGQQLRLGDFHAALVAHPDCRIDREEWLPLVSIADSPLKCRSRLTAICHNLQISRFSPLVPFRTMRKDTHKHAYIADYINIFFLKNVKSVKRSKIAHYKTISRVDWDNQPIVAGAGRSWFWIRLNS